MHLIIFLFVDNITASNVANLKEIVVMRNLCDPATTNFIHMVIVRDVFEKTKRYLPAKHIKTPLHPQCIAT